MLKLTMLRLDILAFFSSRSSLSWVKGRFRLVGPGWRESPEVAVLDGRHGIVGRVLAALAEPTQRVGRPSRCCCCSSFFMASAENMWKFRFSATGDGGGAEMEEVVGRFDGVGEGEGADGVGGRLRTAC